VATGSDLTVVKPDAPPYPAEHPAGTLDGAATEPASATPPIGHAFFRRIAAALGYRDFRILWLGACTSSIGTWMQKVAQAWLVLELTDSAWYLALDTFVGELPLLLFTLIGGVVADRVDRRKLLLASQLVQMSSAFTLALLVWSDVAVIWHILTLSFVSGCAQAFGGPAYQSLIPSLVTKDHLPNAIALNSIQFNLARVIGPLLAGATLHAFGMVSCFTINGISFLVVIGALLALHVQHQPLGQGERHMFNELKGGLEYVRGERSLVVLTVLAFATTFLGIPLLTLLPLVARNIFHQGVGGYSEMMAFSGFGAVSGALVVAWLGRFRHMGLASLLIQLAFGLLVVAFAMSRAMWLSQLLLVFTGATLIMAMSMVTSLVQLIAPNQLRGRVMSIYMVAFRGGMPLGSLVSGKIADVWSAPAALAVNGVLLTVVALYFLTRSHGIREL
jgi:MFS family permease